MQSNGQKEIWDFLPIKGDPTPEERIQLLKDAKVAEEAKNNAFAKSVIADFKNRGII